MRLANIMVYLAIALGLAGCGYHPLYTTASDGRGVADSLSSISIQEASTRAGQLVRNNLLSSMRPAGTAQQNLFNLVLTPTVAQTVLVDKDKPGIQRKRLRLSVAYQLIEISSGSAVNSGKTFSNISYDVVHEPIADLQAESNATDRAAQEVGDDIRTRLAAFMASR